MCIRDRVGDTELSGATQNRQAVVDEQAARRIEVDVLAQGEPELLVLLGKAVVVRADQALEPGRQFDPFHLQRQRIAMRVGDQHHAFAGLAQGAKEQLGLLTPVSYTHLAQTRQRNAQAAVP